MMVGETGSYVASEPVEKIRQSDSKVMVGEKRAGEELEEDSDSSRNHVKVRDLQSVLQSEGIDTHDPENSNMEEIEEHLDIVEIQSSQVIDNDAVENADIRYLQRDQSSTFCVDDNGCKQLDLNCEVCPHDKSGFNDTLACTGDPGKHAKSKKVCEHKYKSSSSGTHLDLNAEDVASSVNQDPMYSYKSHNHQKMRDPLECGRTNRLEEKDALRKWKEMKQNGFMSPSYGGIPAAPKPRGRKSKNDVLKQKMEQAKKEQVDRFTKIAAPSGLLNGLNPGIINHVRNSKQVHSIIQALVRSEKRESRRQCSEARAGSGEPTETNTEKENTGLFGANGSILPYDVAAFRSMPQSKLLSENTLSHNSSFLLSSENRGVCRDLTIEEGRVYTKPYVTSHAKNNCEEDVLALKLSSSNMVTESTSCLSNEDSVNVNSVDNLSVNAASVASQWLQLLQQDIKGRLGALRRSKKRVRAVITTELPFLLSKEFATNQDNDPYCIKDYAVEGSNKVTAELHQAKWSKLFHQMDTTLSEEEKQLECWLNQVNQMLLHCDEGLQHVQWNTMFEMQHLGTFASGFRTKIHDPEKDLSVRAAAASIYSTCNFVSTMENVSCC